MSYRSTGDTSNGHSAFPGTASFTSRRCLVQCCPRLFLSGTSWLFILNNYHFKFQGHIGTVHALSFSYVCGNYGNSYPKETKRALTLFSSDKWAQSIRVMTTSYPYLHKRNPTAVRHLCAQRCDSENEHSVVTAALVTVLR